MGAEEAAGQELRRLRLGRGWSQEETARRMDAYGYGWHQTIIAKIESAGRPLRLREAVDLADLFGVPLESLLGSEPEDEARREYRLALRETVDRRKAVQDAAALHAAAAERLEAARQRMAALA